jgi:hypothetical protein
VLVLLMRGIYDVNREVFHWDALMWYDIRIRMPYKHSSNIKVLSQQFERLYNSSTADGRDL